MGDKEGKRLFETSENEGRKRNAINKYTEEGNCT
jgi:hypothetical protein